MSTKFGSTKCMRQLFHYVEISSKFVDNINGLARRGPHRYCWHISKVFLWWKVIPSFVLSQDLDHFKLFSKYNFIKWPESLYEFDFVLIISSKDFELSIIHPLLKSVKIAIFYLHFIFIMIFIITITIIIFITTIIIFVTTIIITPLFWVMDMPSLPIIWKAPPMPPEI